MTDDGGVTGTDTATVTVTEAAYNTMHISGIDMSTSVIKRNGWYTYARAIVTIVNADGEPVQGATVSADWSGITSDADSGETDSAGQVTLESDPVKKAVGTFTFTVDDVSLAVWEYVSTANYETSGLITVP